MRRTFTGVVDRAELEAILRPRDGLVEERIDGEGEYVLVDGPLRAYRRTVSVVGGPAAAAGAPGGAAGGGGAVAGEPGAAAGGGGAVAGKPGAAAGGGGAVSVTQTVEFEVGLPFFSAVFVYPVRWALTPLRPRTAQPWWAPPQRLDRRAAEVLATLCALAVIVGYVGSVLTITLTYAATQFGADRGDQGVALGVVRANVVLALGVLALADRHGRRRPILACAAGASALTALGALAPALPWLVATQVLAVALTAALLILIAVMAAEEVPAGSRAWALAVLTMTAGLGGGLATALLPLASLGVAGWRASFVAALVFLPLVGAASRHLPESRRWRAVGPDRHRSGAAPATPTLRRLALLCCGAFLFALFVTPSGQFHNEFLRTQRGFSATRISVFTLISGTVGGAGVLLGGKLADLHGRRLVAALGVGGGIVTTVALYATHGWPLWAWGVADSLLGYAVTPALAVYGPELFPTAHRSRATGIVALGFGAGGAAGLVAAGVLSDRFGTFAPAFAVLAAGPLILVLLIAFAYPETARRTLEELNPDVP